MEGVRAAVVAATPIWIVLGETVVAVTANIHGFLTE